MHGGSAREQVRHFFFGWWFRRFAPASAIVLILLSLVTQVLVPAIITHAASTALTIAGGPGTYTNGPTVYARNGQALSLTFTTAQSGAACAAIYLGTVNGTQVAFSGTAGSSWAFMLTVGQGTLAGLSDGSVTLAGAAGTKTGGHGTTCNTNDGQASSAFTVDNTAPTVAAPPTVTPAPNGANWNHTTATVKLNFTDGSGSGFKSATYSVSRNTPPATCTGQTYDPVNGFAVGGQGDGTYFILYCGTDNVGNVSGSFAAQVFIDQTKPTITGARSPAANSFGWNNTSVTVTFSCSDATSGIASCAAAQTVSTEGANQSVTGTATDIAGNANSGTVSGINVDKTPPTIAGAPTTAPNPSGWYNGPVTIHWTCVDALSGVPSGGCPADSTLATEGQSVTASASVSDKAGNPATGTSSAVAIDVTAPHTTVIAPAGWNNSNVTLNLNATDNLSGIAATYYTVDGGSQQVGTTIAFTTDGDHALTFWSMDNAGNFEAAQTVHVKIDKTPPTVTHTQTPAPNGAGWNNANVTVTFTCADAASGAASCDGVVGTSGSTLVTAEGQNQVVNGVGVDNAGNSTTDPALVSIDKTTPSISGAADRAPNANGWYNAPVTVTFLCADALSGVASPCGPTQTLSTDGGNQQVAGTVADAAGNSSSASITGINIDRTAPTITGAATTSPNGTGWYQGDVVVHWTCADAGSGVAPGACPADTTIGGEGSNLSASASVTDRAGNTATGLVSGIKIDRIAPVTTASAVSSDWTNSPVTVNLTPSDNLSGVQTTSFIVDGGATQTGTSYTFSTDGIHTFQFWSVDNAGNTEDRTAVGHNLTIKIDTTNPTITASVAPAANGHGWNNSDVTVHFDCADPASAPGVTASGVASCTADQTVATEGAGQQVTGAVVDHAGNVVTLTIGNINVDKSAPTLSGGATTSPNGNGWYNGDVVVHWSANDAVSGMDLATVPPDVTQTGEGTGLKSSAVVADNAGNTTNATSTPVNIDRTAPQITGAPTTAPSGFDASNNGWYNSDVLIHWTCIDPPLADQSAGSGVATCQADSTISGEGFALVATGSATDRAGNTTANASQPVNIDRTPPSTLVNAPAGWNNTNVNVTLDAHDTLSGVHATYYTLDGAPQQTYSTPGISISAEGDHTLTFWSEDNAGNFEAAKTVHVLIDKTAPTITDTHAPAANANGWNQSDVTVTFVCADALSGIASCTAPQTVSTEGKDQSVTGTAKDNAGNTATDPALVSIDKTPPTITGTPTTPANAHGWYKGPVMIHWACADGLSGIATCPADAIIATEGTGLVAHGTATDAADNSASADSAPVNIDLTPPTITGAPTAAPNANGWYNGNVVIHWTCSDALSGLDGACPADSTITGEGDSLQATASVSDLAGNVGTATVSGIRIDRTAPATSWSAAADYVNGSGVKYYGHDFDVTLAATDDRSGVDQTYSILDGGAQTVGTVVVIAGEGEHTLQFWSVDKAGNVEQAQTQTFRIDRTGPTISASRTPANGNGWNNGDVHVTFTCADPALADGKPGSGVATCDGDTVLTEEGANQAATGTATDQVGNATTFTVGQINIDKTKPTITGGPDRPANANGWYNAHVIVSFTCGDALSGIATCTAPVTLGEGANQVVTGTASDKAGNSATATVSGLNVDQTAPTLAGAPTTSANANGWYNGDVTIHWTCADALSGIPTSGCPADGVITGEGGSLGASASVSDRAGNTTAATVAGVKIDRTPPSTAITAPNNWVNRNVTVTLAPADNLSGVAVTYYVINGAGIQTGASFTLSQDGIYTIQYWSVDNAGNAEATHTAVVKIDQTAPTITHTQSPAPNSDGWNNTDVTVTFLCADNLSGVQSCTVPRTIGAEGAGQTVTGTALDNAGNTATDTATLSIDKTPPTITGGPDRPANANGWYNAPVTITYSCNDVLSGIASCSSAATLGEGANQAVTGTASDKAGNSATATVSGLNVDQTAPTLAGAPTTSANANGWYNGDVTIHWTCADALSGIPTSGCPADTVLTGEGAAVTASVTVADNAGNTTSQSVTVRIDRHAPITTAAYPAAIYGNWYNGAVAVTLTAADTLAGVASTYYRVDSGAAQSGTTFTLTGNGQHTISYWSVDNAGNEEAHHSAMIGIDTTRPTISGAPTTSPNANGWYSTPVTVHFICADADSGVASCEPDHTLNNDGAAQSVSGTATDYVGNSAQATVAGINVDRTSPSMTVSVGSNTWTDGAAIGSVTVTHTIAAPFTLGMPHVSACTATDATSGLAAACAGTVSGGMSNGVGSFTYTASATDKAGNTTTVVVTYQVTYAFSGFLQPINYTAHQIGASSSTFKGGSTVPVKFQLRTADGTLIQSGNAPQWIDVVSAGVGTTPATSAPVATNNGGTFRWDASGQQYIYNWSTSGFTVSAWYRIGVKLDDGQTYAVYIYLR